jgi:NosR/NirI family nitrous oxide reductase transcriptional regulator
VRMLLAVGFLVVTLSVAFAADRIFTNPKPDAHLKKLFPQAVAFSKLEGTPLHFKAYAVDPKTRPDAKPIGYAFWTTDLAPGERGYHSAIHFLVGLDLTGTITGVALDYDSEPYGYFSIEPPEFVAQFKGKSVRDPFRLGQDVDAVSRATITMTSAVRAIRDSARTMARQFLDPAAVKP